MNYVADIFYHFTTDLNLGDVLKTKHGIVKATFSVACTC